MGTLMIGNFGSKNGVQIFRVNGSFDDLMKILIECKEMDAIFVEVPKVEPLRQGQWTVLLKIKLPVGVKHNDKKA